MRRSLSILTLLVLFFSVQGQILKFEYLFSEIQIEGSGAEKSISVKNCRNTGLYGNPSLPWRACNLALPLGTVVERVVVTPILVDTFTIQGIVRPAGYVRPISMQQPVGEAEPNVKVYSSSDFIGQNFDNIDVSIQVFNSLPVMMFNLLPVKYNPLQGKLIFYKKVVVEIYGKLGNKYPNMSQHNINILECFIDNNELSIRGLPQNSDINQVDILLITSLQYINDLSTLTQNYHSIGKKTKIVTTESIQTSFGGSDLAEKIRNCIKYYTENKSTNYVLLAGDTEIIPTRKLRSVVQSSNIYTEDIPSDLYYSAIDGSWDTNQNGIFGEPTEADLLPDVAIGRIPFSNRTELHNILVKITRYQFSPVVDDTNKPLLVGEHLWDNPLTFGAQYLDLIVGEQNENGYSTIGIPDSDPYDSLYDRFQIWNENDLFSKLGSGVSFIHHVGHSNFTTNMRLTLNSLNDYNFSEVNGIDRLNPLIYSHGCLAAAFDENLSIAEKMVLMQNFACGYVGNSRYGWFNEGQTEGPSAHLHREFINALYGFNVAYLGNAHQISQLRTAAWVDLPSEYEPGAQRWVFYACNVLGDPLMGVWTDTPTSTQFSVEENLYAGMNQIQINCAESDRPICLALIDKEGTLRGVLDTANLQNTMNIYPTVREPDTLFLISSGVNIQRDTVPVIFTQPMAPTLVFNGFSIVGSDVLYGVAGDNLKMILRVENVGLTSATNCKAIVSALTPGIEVEGVEIEFSTIEGSEVVEGTELLEFFIPNTVENGSNTLFQIDLLIENQINHTDYFQIPVFAPILLFDNSTWDDNLCGNGNGVLERGEVVIVHIPITNAGGVETDTLQFNAFVRSENATLANNIGIKFPIESMQSDNIQLVVRINDDIEVGDSIKLELIVMQGQDADTLLIHKRANLPIEEFVNYGFTYPVWENQASVPWTFSNSGVGDSFSLQSGAIGDNQSTEVSATIEVEMEESISFWLKTSCEFSESANPYDYLEFRINGVRVGYWDNYPNWHRVSFSLSPGVNQLSWTYVKDGSYSAGYDAVWIDRVIFPPVLEIAELSNNTPQILNLSDTTFTVGQDLIIEFETFDPDNDPIQVYLVNNPSWITVTQSFDGWKIEGRVPDNAHSENTFQVIASDGKQAIFKSITIEITGFGLVSQPLELCNSVVYPNPARNYCVISGMPVFQPGIVIIYNSIGQKCGSFTLITDETGKIVIKKFGFIQKKGVYLLYYQFGICEGTTVLLID